jgi:hypothetical protein
MVRQDAKLLNAVMTHITSHMDNFDLMADGNPTLLNLVMGQPMPLPVPNPTSGVGPQAQPAANPEAPIDSNIGAQMAPPDLGGQASGSQSGEPQALAMQALNSAANKMKG